MSDIETISAKEIDRYLLDKSYLLVDVRNPSEYRKMNICCREYKGLVVQCQFCTVIEAV